MKEDGVDEQPVERRQRLFLHIGVPKSGSTYLQSVLSTNRAALREHGYAYPFVTQEGMFHAAVEMAGVPARWGLDPDRIRGTFAHLLRRGRRLGGIVVLSHEIFGGATPEQIAVMKEMLSDFDVEVVISVRDLGRTATADWQERVKNGSPRSFQEYADQVLGRLAEFGPDSPDFWRPQNLRAVLDRWGALAPPERTHVVVCPPGGAPTDLLWRRFAEAVGLPAEAVDLGRVDIRNESLGTAQIAFLRRVLDALDGRIEQPWHALVTKRWFAQSLLSRTRSSKPATPPTVVATLAEVSQRWVDHVATGGYQVHGDLAELIPQDPPAEVRAPDDVTDAEMLDGLPQVVAQMLVRVRDDTMRIRELEAEVDRLGAQRDRAEQQAAELSALVDRLGSRRHRWLPYRKPVRRITPVP